MQRNEISVIRIVAMIMVVVCHCYGCYAFGYSTESAQPVNHIVSYEHFSLFLDSIDLSAFVFISGYLFGYLKLKCGKYNNLKSFLTKKAQRLLIPYIIWGIVIILAFNREYKDLIYSVDHLWFLLMLTLCFICIIAIKPIWEKMSLTINLIVCVGFVVLYYALSHFNLLTHLFCFDNFLIFFPFFYIGVLLVRFNLEEKIQKYLSTPTFLILLIATMVVLLVSTDPESRFHSDLIRRYDGFCIGVLIFLYLAKHPNLTTFATNSIVKSFDVCSMGIYILHPIIIMGLLRWCNLATFLNAQTVLAPIALVAITLFGSWGITALFRKIKLGFVFGN